MYQIVYVSTIEYPTAQVVLDSQIKTISAKADKAKNALVYYYDVSSVPASLCCGDKQGFFYCIVFITNSRQQVANHHVILTVKTIDIDSLFARLEGEGVGRQLNDLESENKKFQQ